ncbi:MAG TPA: winged helix DNA-binding domain-containing protein, partial [Actinomycetota bacterium]|nr:winged helix DNA-binding domain-containing protein [Actinomycetota bacterium]
MSPDEIRARRMRAQRLHGRAASSPEEVVRLLGAVQAQELAFAKWSVAQRAGATRERDVDRLLADGAILRTHVLRPTWHFVLPEDIRWMLALTGPRILAGARARYRELGLDARTLSGAMDVVAGALEGGRHRTRKELGEELRRRRIDPDGQRLPWLLGHAELEGLVCSGAPTGKQQTYALLDERAPDAKELDEEEALRELAHRYFASHGPATVNDFTWWSSLTAAQARRGLELNEDRLTSGEVDGRTYWFEPGRARPRTASPNAALVQVYDESVV